MIHALKYRKEEKEQKERKEEEKEKKEREKEKEGDFDSLDTGTTRFHIPSCMHTRFSTRRTLN